MSSELRCARERQRYHNLTPEQRATRAERQLTAERARYARNPEKYRAKNRAKYARDPQRHRDRTRRYFQRHPERKRANRRAANLANYGITVEQYNEMLMRQGGCCALCGGSKPGGNGEHFHVDHDHATDRVRGLLCHGCNTGIGGLRDDPELCRRAADYLAGELHPVLSVRIVP